MVKKWLQFLNENNQISEIIENIIVDWEINYNIKRKDINTGDCYIFADKLISKLYSYGIKDCEYLDNDFFYDTAILDRTTKDSYTK
ncbi:hypothetical protein M0Q97_11130 [Candidatus Dojkabacteria bacterium]|jgi:hypothetical protein|nr:hypothetical protein [Candidatus Dojkabacteria bacterium]